MAEFSFWPYSTLDCPDRNDHRFPQGPNEDLAQCGGCGEITYSRRPAGVTFGWHLEDCSLPVDHLGYCQPGGEGHPRPEGSKVRGYWPPPEMGSRA